MRTTAKIRSTNRMEWFLVWICACTGPVQCTCDTHQSTDPPLTITHNMHIAHAFFTAREYFEQTYVHIRRWQTNSVITGRIVRDRCQISINSPSTSGVAQYIGSEQITAASGLITAGQMTHVSASIRPMTIMVAVAESRSLLYDRICVGFVLYRGQSITWIVMGDLSADKSLARSLDTIFDVARDVLVDY